MPDFITNIDWSNPITIGIVVGIVVVLAVACYLFWASSKGKWPFNKFGQQ